MLDVSNTTDTLGFYTGFAIEAAGDGMAYFAPPAFYTCAVSLIVGIAVSILPGQLEPRGMREFKFGAISLESEDISNGGVILSILSFMGITISSLADQVAPEMQTFGNCLKDSNKTSFDCVCLIEPVRSIFKGC